MYSRQLKKLLIALLVCLIASAGAVGITVATDTTNLTTHTAITSTTPSGTADETNVSGTHAATTKTDTGQAALQGSGGMVNPRGYDEATAPIAVADNTIETYTGQGTTNLVATGTQEATVKTDQDMKVIGTKDENGETAIATLKHEGTSPPTTIGTKKGSDTDDETTTPTMTVKGAGPPNELETEVGGGGTSTSLITAGTTGKPSTDTQGEVDVGTKVAKTDHDGIVHTASTIIDRSNDPTEENKAAITETAIAKKMTLTGTGPAVHLTQ